MKSLELNRAYYRDCVFSVLQEHCPQIAGRHAAALIGYGSEVLGNDDEFSKRYGWGPRLLLFLTKDDHKLWGQRLFDVFQQNIPIEFLGHPTRYSERGSPQPTIDLNAPVGIAITTCERFVELYLGVQRINVVEKPISSKEWLLINEGGLLRLTAGEVFHDSVGILTKLREYYRYFPDDVWRYRLAYQWTSLSWDIDLVGICAHRGDILSAGIAASRSVERIIGLVFLLNRFYKPAYLKWVHREFYKLPDLAAEVGSVLEEAMKSPDPAYATEVLYPVLDRLIDYQSKLLGTPVPEYRKPQVLDPGFFKYDLWPVVESVRNTTKGELASLRTAIGAADQWVADQDLLQVPGQLRLLKGIYECDDPGKVLFDRTALEDKGV